MAKQVYEDLLEVDLFIDTPDIELICPICQCVLKDAQQLTTCGHMFCKHCITTHFQSVPAINSCPVDRRVASLANVVDAPRAIVNIISRLQLRCFYYREGCPHILTVESLLGRHAPACPKRARARIWKGVVRPRCSLVAKDSPISVFVKFVSPPKTIVVTITTEATVGVLKQRIHDKDGIDTNDMRLNFNGKVLLNDNEVLSRYGVKNNGIFYMSRRFDGGADHSN